MNAFNLLSIFLFLSTLLIRNTYSSTIEDLVIHMNENGIELNDEIEDKVNRLKQKPIPEKLKFIKAHLEFSQYEIRRVDDNEAHEMAKLILDQEIDEIFEFLYQGFQEICFFYDEPETVDKCSNLEDWYDLVIEKYQAIKNDGGVRVNHASQMLDPDNESRDYIDYNDDPNTYTPNIVDLGRFSPLLKGSSAIDIHKITQEELVEVRCHVEEQSTLNFQAGVLDRLVETLEAALMFHKTPVDEKVRIYCTLYQYYNENNLEQKRDLFLFLNMPQTDEFIDCTK